MPSIEKATLTKSFTTILRLDAAIAYLKEPESISCTRCDKPLPVLSELWFRRNEVKKIDELVRVWPQYICEQCLAERDSGCHVSIAERLTAAGLYGKNRGHSFSGFRSGDQVLARAHHAAKGFATNPKGNLWLYGGPGTGKTHLAAAIVRTEIDRGHDPIFAETPILIQDLIDTYLSPESAALPESKWATCALLVLDDLGTEKITERGLELLTVVVNARNLHDRPMVVTSNLKPPDLHDKASERLISRLVDNGRIVHMGRDDWRKKRRAS
jgi:DNA replication protein DnaC